METTLKKWGNSQGVLIPKNVCEYLGISIGDRLEFKEEQGGITMRPAKKHFTRSHRLTATELFSEWDGSYQPPLDWDAKGAEIDWGIPAKGEMPW